MINDLDDLIPDDVEEPQDDPIAATASRVALVVNLEPLTILLEGDEDPLEIEPSVTTEGLLEGDTVMCSIVDNELIITGRLDPDFSWFEAFSDGIASAQDAAETALTAAQEVVISANGKNRVFWGSSDDLPTDYTWVDGDTWFDADQENRPYRWSGGAWVAVSFGDGAIGNLDVAKLVGDTISGNFLLAGSLKTADTGQRVETDRAGIRLYDDAGRITTNLSATGNSNFSGQIEATGIEVVGNIKIGGAGGTIAPGASLTIEAGTSAPANAPTVEVALDKVIVSGLDDGDLVQGVCWESAAGEWFVSTWNPSTPKQIKITRHSTAGVQLGVVGTIPLVTANPQPGIGIAGGEPWIFRQTLVSGAYGLELVAVSGAKRTIVAPSRPRPGDLTATHIGNAGTDTLAITYRDRLASPASITRYNPVTGTSVGSVSLSGVTAEAVAYGNFDIGSATYARVEQGVIRLYTGAGVSRNADFIVSTFSGIHSMGFDSGVFWHASDNVIYKHTANTQRPTFAYSWRDSHTAGGPFETDLGAAVQVQPTHIRCKWIVTTTAFTSSSAPGTPDAARIYASTGGWYYLQGESTSGQVVVASLSVATPWAGGTPFPVSTPGVIQNSTGDIVLPGDGPAVLVGVNQAAVLPAETDLDWVLTPGLYAAYSDEGAASYPKWGYWTLEVLDTGSSETGPTQRITRAEASPLSIVMSTYIRHRIALGNWTPWQKIGGPMGAKGARYGDAHPAPNGWSTATGFVEKWDDLQMFNPSTGVMVIPYRMNGLWVLSGSATFAANATGRRFIQIERVSAGGAAGSGEVLIRHEVTPSATAIPTANLYTEQNLIGDANLIMSIYQSSGADLDIRADIAPTAFSARFLGAI